MSKVIVNYEDGFIWSCEVDAVGDGDAGEICAAACAVGLVGGTLVFAPAVMPWKSGVWRSPTGIVSEWTSSIPGYRDAGGGRHDMRGGSVYSERGTVEEAYARTRYVLRTPEQLEKVVSVTVDGVLAYAREDGKLVSAVGDDGEGGGMASDFAVDNRPTASDPFEGAQRAQQGIRFEPEAV